MAVLAAGWSESCLHVPGPSYAGDRCHIPEPLFSSFGCARLAPGPG